MVNKLLVLLFGFVMHISLAQDSLGIHWQEKSKYAIDSNEVWAVDGLGNFYFSNKSTISKVDLNGVVKFSQSIKSLGKTKQLIPINTMKLLHFSEEQQRLCYFDNTLTPLGDCIELGDLNIVNGVMIAPSNQPDKVWIIDNVNSKLILLALQSKSQGQEIGNLAGVLRVNNISQIIERNNRLYLLDKKKGIYTFDLYGSLIDFKEEKGVLYIDANNNSLFLLKEQKLKIIFLNIEEPMTINLPIDNVSEFLYKNQSFFFRTPTHVHKLSLQILE